jgi:hypothetical protein
MAIIPSQVLDANEDVIAYYLAMKQWNSEEFAALFCGVNPIVWARKWVFVDGKKYMVDLRQAGFDIVDMLKKLEDHLDLTASHTDTPHGWRKVLTDLGLDAPAWMSQIAEPVQVNNSPSIQALVDQDAKSAAVTAREDRPLATRERNTLLTIIAALCKHSAINVNERGVACEISCLTEKIGAPVSDDTVRHWLKKIPEALATRGN